MAGWTCQHDDKGFCRLLKVVCQPGIKGCTINKGAEVLFSSGNYEKDKEMAEEKTETIDFAALARSH